MAASREHHQQLKTIFFAARDLSPDQREDFILKACAGDEALLRDVRSLLQHDELPTSPELGRPDGAELPAAAPGDRLLNRTIGAFRIERTIASGGMGTVYEAWQESPSRKVALKVLRTAARSPQALRRFEYESEILGRLRHPCIAQVHEAGTFSDGGEDIPYFAMEYINSAMRITDYAAAHGLSIEARLTLFARACDAIHHAHQKGIIHRDLKPGNILVDPAGQPRIIDFGVARITGTDGELDVTRLQTSAGEIFGTLPYMSPEQTAAGTGDIDTRCDIYALGIVLYELLTGRTPFDIAPTTTLLDLQRMIVELDPPRPSARLNTNGGATGGAIYEQVVVKRLW